MTFIIYMKDCNFAKNIILVNINRYDMPFEDVENKKVNALLFI